MYTYYFHDIKYIQLTLEQYIIEQYIIVDYWSTIVYLTNSQ